MEELISKELLSLVLGIRIGSITELKPYTENDLVYSTYTLPTTKYKILNLDTLDKLCIKWIVEKQKGSISVMDSLRSDGHLLNEKYTMISTVTVCLYPLTHHVETIKEATEWVAKGKGLL